MKLYVIRHGNNQSGIEEISISVGESFLHPDLFEMVGFCKENRIRAVVYPWNERLKEV